MNRHPLFQSEAPQGRRTACRRAGWLLLALTLLFVTPSATAQVDDLHGDSVISEGWERIGSFKGSTSSRLWQRINDALFEQEAGGALYRDLGDITLGLGYDTDNIEADWDNSFFRRVLPLHREIPRGGVVTGEDYSRYLDLQTLISRGRLSYNYVPGFVDDLGGIGVRVEGGASLTLGRIHQPMQIGDRPLEEALDDPGRELESIARGKPTEGGRSLIRLSAEGIAGLTRWLAGYIGDRVVDTERSAIFFENYADPITLFIDLDIPVEAALFTAGDTRLVTGDMVRHVTFLGLSPLAIGVGKYGIEANYSHYYRFIRETTIVKEEDGFVVVQVRTILSRGNELTPLKIRPSVRILGILKIGYTFFEQIYGNARGPSYDIVYRVNLNDERGMACFKALLGEGTRVKMRPLAEAAVKREGAEVLHTEERRARDRINYNRTRFFHWLKNIDRRTASSDIVTTGDEVRLELIRTRNRRFEKRFGKRRKSHLSFFVRSQSGLFSPDQTVLEPKDLILGKYKREGTTAVTMLTSVRNDYATGGQVRRTAGILSRALDWEPHPVLDELATVDPDLVTRFVLNFRLSFNDDHVLRVAAASEDEVWAELAHILLGADHRDDWSSREKRKAWKKGLRKSSRLDVPPVFDDLGLKGKDIPPRKRYKLAKRAFKKFKKVQGLALGGGDLRNLTRSFASWWDITTMKTLMVRLGRLEGEDEVGYHYEVFIDEMLRPVTVTNGIVYEHPSRLGVVDAMEEVLAESRGEKDEVEALEQEHVRGGRQWKGDYFVEPSSSRLKGGDLLVNTSAAPEAGGPLPPCWKLRLYSDLNYSDGLTLRVDLRDDGGIKADRPIGYTGFSLDEPTAVEATPFMTARYYYDVPLPAVEELESGKSYVLLLRILNADGLPVSEEQQLRFRWPEEGIARAIDCYDPPLSD